jgi:hypothetical protein
VALIFEKDTAPDRKDIIRDKKYSDMMELLKLYIEELCLQYMEEKDEKSIDKYADTIERYVTVDKIMNRIRFLVFNGKNDGKLLDQVLRISKKERTDDFSTIEAYLKEGAEVQPESHFEQIDCVQRSKPVPHPDRSAHSYSGGGGSYTPATPIVSEKERMETQGLEYFGKKSAKFWVALSDLTEYEKKIDILKFYNLDLVMSRNALETKVLAHMEKQKKISHISTLEDTVTITSSLSNTELNKKEERALMLFEMVSRMCGFDRNIFAIGNLCVSRTFEIEGLDYKDEAVLDDVVAIRNYDVDKIYIDRSIVKTSGLRNDLFPILTLEDYKFILRNIDDLAEEISFMLKKSANTIREELIHALAGVK